MTDPRPTGEPVTAGDAIFSRRWLILWSVAAIVTFLCALYFMGKGDGDTADLTGPSAASRSSVGYAGIFEILRQLDVEVVRSRGRARSIELAHDLGVLIVTEPRLSAATMAAGRKLMGASSVLLILPKWDSVASKAHAGWIEQASLTAAFLPTLALNLVDPGGEIRRGPVPAHWDRNKIGIVPALAAPMQFIRSDTLTPLVAQGDRILVGELKLHGSRIFVLADPDVLSNHGLAEPMNADFAVALISKLRQGDGPVVFDESLSLSAGSGPNLFGLLFRFPLLTGAVLSLIAVGLMLWSAMPRFGAPEAPALALTSGKQGLIDNMAALVGFAGHRPAMISRFVDATIQDVARQLHAPRGLTDKNLNDWLGRVGKARGVLFDPAETIDRATMLAEQRRPDPAALVLLARNINQWKRDIIHGAGRHQTPGRELARGNPQGDRRAG